MAFAGLCGYVRLYECADHELADCDDDATHADSQGQDTLNVHRSLATQITFNKTILIDDVTQTGQFLFERSLTRRSSGRQLSHRLILHWLYQCRGCSSAISIRLVGIFTPAIRATVRLLFNDDCCNRHPFYQCLYPAAFIGDFSDKSANYKPKLTTVNHNANALP